MRQQPPGAACPQPVRQCVEDLPPRVLRRPTTGLDRRNQRTEDLPLRIRQIRRVSGTQPAHPSPRECVTTPLPGDLPDDGLFRRPLVMSGSTTCSACPSAGSGRTASFTRPRPPVATPAASATCSACPSGRPCATSAPSTNLASSNTASATRDPHRGQGLNSHPQRHRHPARAEGGCSRVGLACGSGSGLKVASHLPCDRFPVGSGSVGSSLGTPHTLVLHSWVLGQPENEWCVVA